MIARARREAEQIVTSARTQAEQMATKAQADLDRNTSAARAELDIVQRRRDGIVAQLAALRDLMAGFAGEDESAAEAAGQRRQDRKGGGRQAGRSSAAHRAAQVVRRAHRGPSPRQAERAEAAAQDETPTRETPAVPEAEETQVLSPVREHDRQH